MKKTWIKVKRGLLTPRHREALGIRVWLYMYMIDQADWETGKIFGWRDKEEAENMGMPWKTLQKQRQKLDRDNYISCKLVGDKQEITIHNWTNPREYSGQVYNELEGVPKNGYSTREGVSKVGTLPFNSHITLNNDGIEYIELFPDKLKDSPEFVAKWGEWLEYRKKARKKKVSEYAAKRQAKHLGKYNVLDAIKVIEISIANDYQGLFDLKDNGKRNQNPPAEMAGKGWDESDSDFVPDELDPGEYICKVCWCTPCICDGVKAQQGDEFERVRTYNHMLQRYEIHHFRVLEEV